MEYKSSATDVDKYLRSRKIPSTACSGCGLGMNHKIVVQAIDELGLEIDDIIWGTSIGCAGRQTFATWKGDGFAGTHGRVYAIARGLRMALPPEKKIILTVGDGDAFGIGLHASDPRGPVQRRHDRHRQRQPGLSVHRRAVRLDHPPGSQTDSSPYGMFEPNLMGDGMDVMDILKGAGATFLARHVAHGRRRGGGNRQKGDLKQGFFPGPHALSVSDQLCFQPNWAPGIRSTFTGGFKEHAAPLGQEKADTVWATGIWHDASNSRPELSRIHAEPSRRSGGPGSI